MKAKTILMSVALLGLLSTGSFEKAGAQTLEKSDSPKNASISDLSVLQVKPMQFRVSFNNKQSRKLSVRIVDTEKNVLYSENSNVSANYLKYFDLSPLLDGTYTFEVMDGKEKYSQSFDILTQTRRIVSAKN
jgi:hypothetical protein